MTGRGETVLQTAPACDPCRQLLMRTWSWWRSLLIRGTRLSPPVLGWLSHCRLHILELHTFSCVLRGGLDSREDLLRRLQSAEWEIQMCMPVAGGTPVWVCMLSISCPWPVASTGPRSIPFQLVYHQSCLLWTGGKRAVENSGGLWCQEQP